MSGGLGNQMFEYALYLKYKSLGIDAKFEDWTEYENRSNRRALSLKTAFGIDYPRATLREYHQFTDSFPGIAAKIKRRLKGRHSSEYIEASCNFDPEILKKNDTYVRGYFQSEKYFKDIEDTIRSEFTFTEKVRQKAYDILIDSGLDEPDTKELIGRGERCGAFDFGRKSPTDSEPIGASASNPINLSPIIRGSVFTSIHIRRGDYLNLPENYGNICTEEYYDRAIRHIRSIEPDTIFLVFSNDPEWALLWAQQYLKTGIEMIVVTGTSEDDGYVDMFIQSCCNHNIIANSSFSWWGAYLNQNDNRVVIAPSKWANHIDQQDIYSDWMTKL